MSLPTEKKENEVANGNVNQSKGAGTKSSKKRSSSFARNRSSLATVLSQESDSNEDWPTEDHPSHPFENASFLSKMFFLWPYELMKKKSESRDGGDDVGNDVLKESDLPDVLPEDSSGENLFKFNVMWMAEKRRAEGVMEQHRTQSGNGGKSRLVPKAAYPSLRRAVIKDYLGSLWFLQPIMAVLSAAKLLQAVALGKLLQSFERGESSYLWAGVLVMSAVVILLTNHQVYFWTWRKGMQTRIACIAAIYDKTLRLKSTTSSDFTSGRMINLATNDVDRFLAAAAFGPYIIWGPIMLILILVVGWLVIGWPFAVGIAFMIFVTGPTQIKLGRKAGGLRSVTARATDSRVNAASQAIEGVSILKMMGLENLFQQRIASLRKDEVAAIKKANWYRGLHDSLFFVTNILVSVLVFIIHVCSGGVLSIVNVYTTLALVNIAQCEITLMSRAVAGLSECSVSMRRIQTFLDSPDLPLRRSQQICDEHKDEVSQGAINVSNATSYWNSSLYESDITTDDSYGHPGLVVALDKITLKFHMGELTCIIGEVGSGKSALLQMLAGELPLSSGIVSFREEATTAYAPQDPWIMDGSVRENIVLGRPFDEDFYLSIVVACGLSMDFKQFRYGDNTIVGDRGAQLSGGQRARIALARAFYRDADILLLDDPLSAVDAKVGNRLHAAIHDLGIKRMKCVVLVTHQHQFIGDSRCVMMSGGRVACVGTYKQCVEKSEGKLTLALQNKESDMDDTTQNIDHNDPLAYKPNVSPKLSTTTSINEHKEKGQTGVVKRDTFLNYLRAMPMGLWTSVFILLLCIITQGSVLLTIAVVGKWSNLTAEGQRSFGMIGMAVGLVVVVCVLAIVRASSIFFVTVEASRTLHDRMTTSVLHSQMTFFDTNPIGRILNRFSGDVGSNDDLLPTTLVEIMVFSFIVLGAISSTIVLLPLTISVTPPLIFCFLKVRRIFVNASRELKRIEGMARSPIFAMLSESLSGVSTIRTNGALDYFRQKFRYIHDAHGKAFFAFLSCSRWLGFWIDGLMVVFIAVASFAAVAVCDQEWIEIDPSILGIAFTMLIQAGYMFQWTVRQSAEAVSQMIGVERVIEYCNLPAEAPQANEYDATVSNWPSAGSIDVRSLSVRYRPGLPLSLKNLSFQIESGSRVGIVGRTGSGKSTLVQSILRIIEAETGQILVDGVDTSKLGLQKLRHAISVIPQSPVLFGGCTIRENLDPFDKNDDEQIKKALLQANMLETILDQPLGLDEVVADGGSNFSAGQRQLLCLARAILCRNKILVLDEPTANVDCSTDELLQESVKENFHDATIIAVAHRLDTIITYDKILVLGNGSVLEYGNPYELIQRGGAFAGMVSDTGGEMSEQLISKAKLCALKKSVKYICE